jgi:methylmalonyl-CoA epimerase
VIKKIHHVGVVVREMDQALRFWRDTLGLHVHKQETIEDQGVKAALLRVGDSEVELLEPVVTDNGIARYLQSRGEGLHHVCFEVDDVDRDLQGLKAKSVELIDQDSRRGIAGRICFLHPRAMHGTLVELCQPVPDEPETAHA